MTLQTVSHRRTACGVVVWLPLFLLCGRAAAAESYWTFDGTRLSLVQRDPSGVQAPEWAAFYFRKSAPPGTMSQRWGVDTAASAAAVMKKVQANQKFERYYEKWCECSWGGDTFFNVVAPVALVKPSGIHDFFSARDSAGVSQLHETWDAIMEYRDQFNTAADLVGGQKLPHISSGPLAEFMNNMHETLDRFLSLSDQLMRPTDRSRELFEKSIDRFMDTAIGAQRNMEGALRVLPAIPTFSAVSTSVSCGNRCKSYISGDRYVQENTSDLCCSISSQGTLTRIEQAAVADLDLAEATVEPSVDGTKFILRISCRPESSGLLSNCLDRHLTTGEALSEGTAAGIWCDTEAECRAFLNGLIQAAKGGATIESPASRTAPASAASTPASTSATAPMKAPSAATVSTDTNAQPASAKPALFPAKTAASLANPAKRSSIDPAKVPSGAIASSAAKAKLAPSPAKSTASLAKTAKLPSAEAATAVSRPKPTASAAPRSESSTRRPAASTEAPVQPRRMIVIAKSSLGYVNLRERADTSSPIVGRVRPGEKYTATQTGGWYYIASRKAWVAGRYVTLP